MGLGVAPSLTFQKLSHLGGVQNFLLERRGKTEKGSWCRNGRMPLFYYFTVQSQLLCVWMKVRFPLLLFRSSVFWVSHEGFSSKSLLHWNLVSFVNFWSILVVCKKILTASFTFVCNTLKSKWAISFECQGKMFLDTEKVLEKISEVQP